MPEPEQSHERLEAGRKASIVYGNKFLEAEFPGGGPYSGAWSHKDILGQHFLTPAPKHIRFFQTPAANEASPEVFISGWLEKEGPFTQTNLLDTEEDQTQELISRIRTLLPVPYRETLANRLVTLYNDAKEEDCVSPGIAVGSLRNFFVFLQSHTNLKCPTVSLTTEYNIYASWRAEPNRVFSVHFLSSADARFVIFKPNDKHLERRIRLSGIATTDILMATVAPYGVLDWISE